MVRRIGPLRGTIDVPGAKNSVLKLMASTILADGVYELSNVPAIVDVTIMAELLEAIGVTTTSPGPGRLTMTNRGDLTPVAPYELVERIRASVNVLGPLLTRCGHVRLSMPGGDDFGARPIDMHIAGLEAMGAEFRFSHGEVEARAPRLRGAEVAFEFPSVGATENLVTAAVLADGVTVVDNAAREPEVVDLCEFLVGMGARISGVGTSRVEIEGVGPDGLHAVAHSTVPDRIQAATYMAAVAVAGGELHITHARPEHMQNLLGKFTEMGLELEERSGRGHGASGRAAALDRRADPAVPGDRDRLQAAGHHHVERRRRRRHRHREPVSRSIPIRRGAARDSGRTSAPTAITPWCEACLGLSGAPVRAHDIRAGAAMVVAGLAAEGETVISGVSHIDRGYDDWSVVCATSAPASNASAATT